MPTKLEDVVTKCDHPKLYKANDNFYCAHCHEGMGNGVYEYIGLLEKELRVANLKCQLAISLLSDLHALVEGECPSLLNEDSGGDAALAVKIEELLLKP